MKGAGAGLVTAHTDARPGVRYKTLMDNRERETLEKEVERHRRKIDELVRELRNLETIICHAANAPPQLIRHAVLIRVALKGRRAAVELGAARLEAFARAERASAE